MDVHLQAVCSLVQTHFELHPDPERESKVCATLCAFYIFHKRATDYIQLPAASLARISKRLVTLFDTVATLVPPDCPELTSDHDDTSMALFQKINRYLFQELDSILEEYLRAEMPNFFTIASLMTLPSLQAISSIFPLPLLLELPVPPIEWAVNLIKELDYTVYLALEFPTSLPEWIQTIVDKHYDPTNLMLHLRMGWDAVMARHTEILIAPIGTNHRTQLLTAFVDRLRNTMCYPARVSILSSRLA